MTKLQPMVGPMDVSAAPPFTQLDFLYMPSRDVPADIAFFTEVLGGRLVFAVEGMATRVAMIRLTDAPPSVLLADHVDGRATRARVLRTEPRPGARPARVPRLGAAADLRDPARSDLRRRPSIPPRGRSTGVGAGRARAARLTGAEQWARRPTPEGSSASKANTMSRSCATGSEEPSEGKLARI